MPYMMGRVKVEDYASFRKTFDGAAEMRKAAGALGSRVFQSADDPNEILVEIEFPTVDAAKSFQASQELRDTQLQAGIKEPPRMLVVNET